jgi:mono/diheme cytochrome c family protein
MMKPEYKDEVDWKKLLEMPERLFGYSYIYFLAIVISIGILYISNINTAGKNTVIPVMPGDSSSTVQDIPLQSPRVVPPIDIMKASIPDPGVVEKGSGLFTMNCSSCHGNDGRGDGPTAAMLIPKPRNFHSLSGWKNGSKVSQIYATLENGIQGSAMPAYNYLAPEERIAMIHFVRTLAPDQPKDSEEELHKIDLMYGLSKGMNVAGQIPVKMAMRVIVKEETTKIEEVRKGVEILGHLNGGEAALYRRVSTNDERVVTGLLMKNEMLAGTDDFIGLVASDPELYGFRPTVIRLSYEEVEVLVGILRTCLTEMRR